jgi:hypothetical protein
MALLRTALALLLLLSAVPAAAQKVSGEYQLKAAFLYNFAKFVEWPAGAFPSEAAPVTICVYGEDPFGRTLEELVRNERIGNRPLEVRRPDSLGRLGECHILYVSRSERAREGEVVSSLGEAPVLTVGESESFLRSRGMIGFFLEENKVRFQVNLDAAESSRLKISSKLLRLAKAWTPGGAGTGSPR